MIENNKRRLAEKDRISNLPEHLIDLILEFLPVQDVVKTSILSKKWRHAWTRMRALVADEQFSNKFAKYGAFGRHGVIRIIDGVLLVPNGPIKKFDLHLPNMFLDSFQEVDKWMKLISQKGVKDLAVVNSNQRYQLPSYLFSCTELRELKLDNCIFKPPSKLQEFLNLQKLILDNIDFGANLSETVINLPQLMNLGLSTCTNVYNFNIMATKLKVLVVNNCPDAMLHRLLHSQFLHNLYIFISEPIENLVPVERMNLPRILSNMPKIKILGINGVLYFIAENIPKWLPHSVNCLTTLWLHDFELGNLTQLKCALCLLRNSPNLKSLLMKLVFLEPEDMNYEEGPASNYLESPGCLDQSLNHLQTVTITILNGSKPELLFIQLLLAHSPSLEKLEIKPIVIFDSAERLDIATDVIKFCRASPKAEVIFENYSML